MDKKGVPGSHCTLFFAVIPLLASAAAAQETVSPSRDSAASVVKTIHVVASSHWNLGDSSNERGGTFPYHFSAPPEVVKLDAKAHVDEVLDTCIRNDDFCWTIEALWMFQAWWDNTPDPARRDRMLQFVRDDRITLSAPSHNYRSAFLGGEECNRVCYDAEKWRREFGLPIDTAVMNDVPGYNWSLVQPLSKSGIRYFFAGPNHFIGGALSLTPKENPFWWQGPDGSRILTWISAGGYTEGQTRVYINPSAGRFFAGMGFTMPGVSLNLQESERKKIAAMNDKDLMEYNIALEMERLRNGGYPYDAILVEYSHDTLGPDSIVGTMKYIHEWNASHEAPKIKLSTPRRFFMHMVDTYGADAFPVFPGDWAGLWETTAFPSPDLLAKVRYVREFAPVLEKLSSIAEIAGTRPYPWNDLRRINATILENDDQGGNGTAAPLLAYEATKGLYQATLSLLLQDVATSTPAIVVFNPGSARRTDVVESTISRDLNGEDLALFDVSDSSRRFVAWEKIGERRVRFVATDVPPLGYKVFLTGPRPADALSRRSGLAAPDPTTIENAFYRIRVDPQNGDVASVFDKEAKRELVDTTTPFSLNGLCDSPRALWGPISPKDPARAKVSSRADPVSARLIIEREGSPLARTEIVLYAGVKRVDFLNRFSTAPGEPLARGYFVAFPFAIPRSSLTPRIENANAFLSPGGPDLAPTYLPGAYKDAFVMTRAMDLHDAKGFGIVFANRQSTAVLFDSNTSTGLAKIFTPAGRSNTADIEFPRELLFDFALTSYSGAFDPVRVKNFGEGFVLPLWADRRPASGRPGELFVAPPGPLRDQQLSFLAIDTEGVELSAWKRVETGEPGEYLLRFQEVAGTAHESVTVTGKFAIEDARLADMVERPLPGKQPLSVDPLRFAMGAHETVSIRARFGPFDRKAE